MTDATAADELLALKRGLQKARERAARNGLRLEFQDGDAGPSWPGKRYASAHLFDGDRHVAGAAHSYSERDDGSKNRALLFCSERVYNRPDDAD